MAVSPPGSSFRGAAVKVMCLILLLLFLAPTIAANSPSVVSGGAEALNGSCFAAERDALLSFKAGITSDPSNRLGSWRGPDCCRWYGVSCSTRTGHVMKLDLHNDFFMDDLFSEDQEHSVRWLHGKISASLLALHHLEYLDLGGNVLGDNMPVPEFISSLKSLVYLDLSNMNFSGQLPPHLGNLTKLVYLDIHNDLVLYSYASAYTYSTDVSWLSSLHSLKHLDMSCADLSTAIDWVYSVNTLSNLRALYLYNCQLNTSIPSLAHNNLTVLEELDLHFNSFEGPAAPNWYWDITSLRSLDISGCDFSGPFPNELGSLTMLEAFSIADNNMEGMIPSTLENICNLQVLYLSGNNIDVDITDIIAKIPKCSWNSLVELHLSDANITGTTLKSILNFSNLNVLDISKNHLSGSVPVEIGTLKYLNRLDIGHNSLNGVISEEHFLGLTNLTDIDLSNNYLQFMLDSNWRPPFNLSYAVFSSCHLGPHIPNWLRWQSNIIQLDMSNTSLIGRIPYWFWTTFSKAARVDLSHNQITGHLPLDLEFMSARRLLLQSNQLTGSVPVLPRNITVLDISRNSLNGQLPSNFGGPYLRVALLFSNYITGIIPESMCLCPKLLVLDLSDNQLTGGLPDCGREKLKQQNLSSNNLSRVDLFSFYYLKIHTLLLRNNNLLGEFPLFLKQCQNLMFLDLTQNRFSGQLPTWISEYMPRLVILLLRSNKFSGHIPIETMRLASLRILDLANNTFSGVVPQSIANLKALTATAIDPANSPFKQDYEAGFVSFLGGLFSDILPLVSKGQVLQYRENVIFFMSIDLSFNRLVGQIPEEISLLLGLINVNFSWNFLSGNIPYKIGNLRSLESLDLSNNQLSGGIPWSLSNLTSLSYMNLSYNNLSGRIPTGHQLDTIKADDPTSIYIGNPGLCGHPLPNVCPGDQPVQDRIRWHEDPITWHEDYNIQMDVHYGLIVGFLVGLCVICCSLLLKKTWRYAYFSLLDKLCDYFTCFFFNGLARIVQKTSTN